MTGDRLPDARDDAIGCCWVVAGMNAAGNGSIGTPAILESPLISVTLTIAMILIIITIITRGIKGSSNNSSNNDRRVASLSTIQLSLRLGAAYGMPVDGEAEAADCTAVQSAALTLFRRVHIQRSSSNRRARYKKRVFARLIAALFT